LSFTAFLSTRDSSSCTVHHLSLLGIVCHTEYKQSGNGHFLAYIPLRWKNLPRLVRVGGARPTPFHSIQHHVQSLWCTLQMRGRYTLPISPLPLYILCCLPCTAFLSTRFGNTMYSILIYWTSYHVHC